ncbi:unnamed protein product, partial [Ectocarpus sp. 8 AP-2014]
MKAGCVPALASCTGLLPLAYCITAPATDALSFQLAPGIGTRRCRGQPKVSTGSTLRQVVRFNDSTGAASCSDRSRHGGYPAATLQQQWRQPAKGEGPRSQREGGLPSCPSAADGRIAGPDGSLSAGMFPNRPPRSSASTAAKDSPRAVRREDGEPVLGGAGGGKGGVF